MCCDHGYGDEMSLAQSLDRIVREAEARSRLRNAKRRAQYAARKATAQDAVRAAEALLKSAATLIPV